MQNSKLFPEDFNPNEQLKTAGKWVLFGLSYAVTGTVHGISYTFDAIHGQLEKLTNRLDPRDPRRVAAHGEERHEPWINEGGLGLGDQEVPRINIGDGVLEESALGTPSPKAQELSTQMPPVVTSTRKVVDLGQEVKRVIEETVKSSSNG